MNQAMTVLTSMQTTEWYTPSTIIDRVTLLFDGSISLDPASCAAANKFVKAENYYSLERQQNGLDLPWSGNVFLNPPFNATTKWIDKAYNELAKGNVRDLVILVNSAPGYVWWETLLDNADSSCMLRKRLAFISSQGEQKNAAKKGQTVAYFGTNIGYFEQLFEDDGRIWRNLY